MKPKLHLKAILLDMDGVLWHGSSALLDVQMLFDRIQDLGLGTFCVTNNSTRPVSYHLKKMRAMGVDLDQSQILTSAEATASYLKREFLSPGAVYVIGEAGIRMALEERGFQLLDGEDVPAQAVVVGLDQSFTYRKFELAVRYLQEGAMFVGTNPDPTIPTPTGSAPGAGALIKGVEVSSGVKAHIIGKPHPGLFREALSRAECLPHEALMIGDRLDTDIQGAQQLGLKTALVLSGITTREMAYSWEPKPDFIADTALEVIELLGKMHG